MKLCAALAALPCLWVDCTATRPDQSIDSRRRDSKKTSEARGAARRRDPCCGRLRRLLLLLLLLLLPDPRPCLAPRVFYPDAGPIAVEYFELQELATHTDSRTRIEPSLTAD